MTTNNHYPVALFVFMRPDATLNILNLIADAGIKKLYIFADGPRSTEDKKITNQVRKVVKQFTKTHPEVKFITSFSDTNLGLKKSIVDGLAKVFNRETAAIILEDDCIPSPDFFTFTQQMLTKYKSNPKVLSVSGTGLKGGNNYSYNFSPYQQCWGWATWARAWKLYDPTLSDYDENTSKAWLKNKWHNPILRWYWKHVFRKVKNGLISTWDYQWTYSHLANNKLAIIPSANLIRNIGFDSAATHTIIPLRSSRFVHESMKFPLIHPSRVTENSKLSRSIEKIFYSNKLVLLGMLRYIIKPLLVRNL